jgi:thiamine-monophosphate kinase
MSDQDGGAGAGGGGVPAAGSRSRSGPRLGPGPEFDLVRRVLASRGGSSARGVRLGPGDDAAVVEGGGVVLSCDLSVEEVHFRRHWLDPRAIGYRSAAGALSDLAAMAARPIGVLASIAAAPGDADLIEPIMQGVVQAIEEVGGELLGGDISRSPGPILIDVVAVGEATRPILRSGARPGDELWVTGELGGAGGAVEAWMNGMVPEARSFDRFAAPRARIGEALWLAEREIPAAMLDLSDGLGGDAAHLAAANGVAAVIEIAAVPIDPALGRRRYPGAAALDLALGGGEDYELLLAARRGRVSPHADAFQAAFGLPLTRVGVLEEGDGVHLQDPAGRRTTLRGGGFQHFGASR